jgi:hypothetical protein
VPLTSEDLADAEWLRLLVLGYPKCGKSTTILLTCEKPVYVINCDTESGLHPARRLGAKFIYDRVMTLAEMEKAIATARGLVKTGEAKTVLLDALNYHARHILSQLKEKWLTKNGDEDGRKYWPDYTTRLLNTVERLCDLDCHFIATSHYLQVSEEMGSQIPKSGEGVIPLIEGSVRNQISGIFDDVVFMETRGNTREFVLKTGGKFGPGGRTMAGVDVCDADVGAYWKLCRGASPVEEKKEQ